MQTKSERREDRRNKSHYGIKVSGAGFAQAYRNAVMKRAEQLERKKTRS